MPFFHYQARNRDGHPVRGVMEMGNAEAVASRLRELGYAVEQIRPAGGEAPARPAAPRRRSAVPPRELARFYQELAALWKAGVSPGRALSEIAARRGRRPLGRAAAEAAPRVEAGERLAEALAASSCFPPADLGLLRAGELGGFAEQALRELGARHEAYARLRDAWRLPLLYPALLLLVALFLVLPALAFLRAAVGGASPEEGLQAALDHALRVGLPITLGLIAGGWLLLALARLPVGERFRHAVLLRLPLAGWFARTWGLASFTGALQVLHRSGLPPAEAWAAAAEAPPNRILAERLREAGAHLRSGDSFAGAMQRSGVFPPNDVSLVATAEQAGEAEAALGHLAEAHRETLDNVFKRLPLGFYTLTLALAAPLVVLVLAYAWRTYYVTLIEGLTNID